MGKKHKSERMEEVMAVSKALSEGAQEAKPLISSSYLQNLREDVVQAHNETAHTIAELEAWRDEIDRTIAFLRAHR